MSRRTTQPAVREGPLLRRCAVLSRRGPVSAVRLVPPRRDRSGCPAIRSVPCSMRCTGRPRPIPGVGSTRCMTRSAAETSCGARGSTVRRNNGAPGIDKITLAACRGVRGRPGCSTSWPRAEGGPLPSVARAPGLSSPSRVRRGRAAAAVDSYGSGPDRAGRGEDRARAGLRGGLPAVSASGSARGGRRTMPCRCSSMSPGGAAGGWSRRTSPTAFRRFRTRS